MKIYGRAELVAVAKAWEDLWLGVKGQSNLVIAGSLRKICRYCVKFKIIRGRALFRLGRLIPLLNLEKLRMLII